MNGLINRAIEGFVRDGYGDALWSEVVGELALDEAAFEPLMPCAPEVTERLVAALAARLRRAPDDLLEDLGTYLVSQPRTEAVRRLLRFGGLTLDTDSHVLTDRDGNRVQLTTADFRLLTVLLARPRTVLSREQLLDLTAGRPAGPLDRTIDNQISRLRRKIEADPLRPTLITTVRSHGYSLNADVEVIA